MIMPQNSALEIPLDKDFQALEDLVESGNVIELKTTAGGNGDASDLTVLLTFVSES